MNKSASLPFDLKLIQEICNAYPTPFYLYDERGILQNARNMINTFSWNPGFREYFAVKALPNPHILSILCNIGFGLDCSSMAELSLAERIGIKKESIIFTSNNTPKEEFVTAARLGAIINLDDLEHLSYLEACLKEAQLVLPNIISFRFNPGKERCGNSIIGNPEEAKFGCTSQQLFTAYDNAKKMGIERFGLHAMIASNELNEDYFIETVASLLAITSDISKTLDINFEFINMGGGIGIPYHPKEMAVNIHKIASNIEILLRNYEANKNTKLKLYMECGRYITGPYGYLITKTIHKKQTYKNYIGVDANMANLMRPGMYGAYHHITVLGKESLTPCMKYDVVGSLCENNDKFAVDRILPEINIGDILAIHDAGAHAHAMGFNYNGKLRSAELLLKENGNIKCIRRAETLSDYFATITP